MASKSNRIKIGILGASGYTGAELIRLLARRPEAEITVLTADRHAGKPLAQVFPHLGGLNLPDLVKIEDAEQSADVTLVKGDLAGIARARALSRATMRNIRQNLVLAFVYNALGIPLAAGVLYPAFGLLLSPIVAAAAMSFSSVSVIGNSLRLRLTSL